MKGRIAERENDWNTLVIACGCGLGLRAIEWGASCTGRAVTDIFLRDITSHARKHVNPAGVYNHMQN